MQPILEKANNAIKEVAEENGFIYIFDISRGNPVYFSDKSVRYTSPGPDQAWIINFTMIS